MVRRVLDVFLSSTAIDLAEHRTAVYERLRRTGLFHCIRQEDFGAQDAGAVEFCCRQAQAADLFVGLVGLRRGWEPDGDNARRSITEMEHDWAREAGRRRFLWVAPDDFAVPGHLRESDAQHARQQAFRTRTMGAGERIVSQKGFGSPDLLASEVAEHLMVQLVTGDLITLLRPELAAQNQAPAEEQAPAIAAAVEKLADDKDIDLLALAKNPAGIDVAELEAKLTARAEAHEAAGKPKLAEGERELKASAEYWRHIGALAFLHDTQRSLRAYEKAVALDPGEPEGWRFLGELRYRLGDMDLAQSMFESLLRLGVQQGNKRTESMARLRLGWIHYDQGDPTAAEDFQTHALQLSESANWTEGMARAYGNLGIIYQRRGDLALAEEMQIKALRLNEELSSKEGMALAYGNLGNIHQTRGELEQAQEMQFKALKLDEELGSKLGMAASFCNLGLIYHARGELVQAEEMLLKSLKLEEELGRKQGMAQAYVNLGIIYQKRGDLAKAEEMHLKALKLNEELGRKQGMAITYGNLGNIYSKTGDKARMCDCWRKARDLYRVMGLADNAAKFEHWLKLKGCGDG